MQQPEQLLLHAYERALARLQALESEICQQLTGAIDAQGKQASTLRQLALLEGLRHERNDARAETQRAEAALINHLGARLGIPPDPAS
jgi:hypothetical protein